MVKNVLNYAIVFFNYAQVGILDIVLAVAEFSLVRHAAVSGFRIRPVALCVMVFHGKWGLERDCGHDSGFVVGFFSFVTLDSGTGTVGFCRFLVIAEMFLYAGVGVLLVFKFYNFVGKPFLFVSACPIHHDISCLRVGAAVVY